MELIALGRGATEDASDCGGARADKRVHVR